MNQTTTLVTLRKALLYTSIGALSISALLGIIMVLSGDVDWRIIATTFYAAIASIFATSSLTRFETSSAPMRAMASAIMMFNVAWLILALIVVWDVLGISSSCTGVYSYASCKFSYEAIVKWSITMFVVTLVTSLMARFVTFKDVNSLVAGLKVLTMVSAGMFGLVSVAMIWSRHGGSDLWRLWLVAIILMILGAIVTPLLIWIENNKSRQVNNANSGNLSSVDEQRLRQQIEAEVRAKIMAEQQEKQQSADE